MATPRQDLSHCSVWRLTDGERPHFSKHALLLRAISSILIYNFSFQYTRWEAIFPEVCLPVLMLRTDCSLFALRYAHSSRLLPLSSHSLGRSSLLSSEVQQQKDADRPRQHSGDCLCALSVSASRVRLGQDRLRRVRTSGAIPESRR